jgi:hypothetical protein
VSESLKKFSGETKLETGEEKESKTSINMKRKASMESMEEPDKR